MTDDEIRSMLRTRAAEATVSDDAWQQIAARIADPAPSRAGRRLAVAGVAVAAAAGTVFVANLPGSPQVASPPDGTTTTAMAPAPTEDVIDQPHVFAAPAGSDWTIEQTAHAYLLQATNLDAGEGVVQLNRDGASGSVTYLDGPVVSDVFLQRVEGRWVVDSAASDLVPVHDPVFEEGLLSAEIVAEAAGELTFITGGPVEDADEHVEGSPVVFRQQVPVRRSLPEARYARVQAVLRSEDGPVGVSGTWVTDHDEVDPAGPAGEIVTVWPALDEPGLAQLQADAAEGMRPDLLDPLGVAGGYLAELLPRERSAQYYEIGEFRQGDQTSGEVPYSIDGEPVGEVLLRRSGEGGIWVVTAVNSDLLRLGATRDDDGNIVVDITAGSFDRFEATARTPGGGTVRASGPAPSDATLEDTADSRWVQVVVYRDDRIVAIGATPVP